MSMGRIRRRAALLLVLFTAGCETLGITKKDPPPPCPPVFILKEAAALTRYAPGSRRGITDVDFQAEIVDFRGSCEYNDERTQVDIALDVTFNVVRGPANRDRKAAFDYFIAIPHFHPAPQGKKTLPMSVAFAGNDTRLRVTDQVTLRIPFDGKARLEEYTIYLGFQLTREELQENQRRSTRP